MSVKFYENEVLALIELHWGTFVWKMLSVITAVKTSRLENSKITEP